MKKITVENYESYFLDQLEGRLDATMVQELDSFLVLHPQLKEALEQTNSIYLEIEHYAFKEKQELKKFEFETQPITRKTFDDFCIASYENILSEGKRNELANYMQHQPGAINEYIAYGKTYLVPEKIIFPHHKFLHHKARIKIISLRNANTWLTIAAAMVILAGTYFGFIQTAPVKQIEIKPIATTVNPNKKLTPIKSMLSSTSGRSSNTTQPVGKIISKELMDTLFLARKMEPKMEILTPRGAKFLATAENRAEINLALYLNNYKALYDDRNHEKNGEIIPYAYAQEEIANKRKLLVFFENSLNKINQVTNTSLALNHETNATGQMKSFTIKAGFLHYEWKSNKK